jgi:putative two-component system response regulator
VHARRPSLPVVLVTGAGTYENLSEALTRGADGLVLKPFSHAELEKAVFAALQRASRSEREVKHRLLTPALAATLANAIEEREASLGQHCERLSRLATRFACELELSAVQIETIRLGAILHDVGKIGIPDAILLKPGPFSDEERAIMRSHPLIGDRLVGAVDVLAGVRPIVRHHHERWDGAGYPHGLAGEAIPLGARVVALADAIEAMSAQRPYRQPLGRDAILVELEAGRGTQWDPELVDVALDLIARNQLRFGPGGLEVDEEPSAPDRSGHAAVLLVEDDPQHAKLAIDALEGAGGGLRVVHAADARTAEELCRGSAWSLAIVDHHLPDGDGLELLGSIRAVAPQVPVVLLTGEGSENLAVEAFRQGAADYVVKGEGGYAAELASRVRALLEAA